ncbi:MAG: helix-turn-helix domain-containing protein [Planctomycetota bacterium]
MSPFPSSVKRTVHDQRGAIAELRRQSADLLRRLGFLEHREGKRLATPPPASKAADVRFSPKWVAAYRRRLGFSAKNYARLVGVSPLTIYNWEKGKSKPQAKQLATWASVRGLGKRQALQRLELLPG